MRFFKCKFVGSKYFIVFLNGKNQRLVITDKKICKHIIIYVHYTDR